MPTIGLASATPAADPLFGAAPKGNTPPLLATIQYPPPPAGTAIPTTAGVTTTGPFWQGAKWLAVASSVALVRLQDVSSR